MSGLVRCRVLAAIGLVFFLPAVGRTQTSQDLRGLSLEELMSVSIATPSRLPQSRMRAPASAFVLTADDIRRSGATTMAELLRLVPGLHVARIDGTRWAVGSRGFTDRLARGMLVLIDGRAVYSPLFAGTYWEAQDVPLQDIERIEIIRGPGGALWGANAVTGVINIVRKNAALSDGWRVTAGVGSSNPALAELSYGGSGERVQYRLSGKFLMQGSQQTMFDPGYDDGRGLQAGGRVDWQTGNGEFTLQLDSYRVRVGQRDSVPSHAPPASPSVTSDDLQIGNTVMLRWKADTSNPRSLQVQGYIDRISRNELQFREVQQVYDLDAQQGRVVGRHGLLWGAGYRLVDSSTRTTGLLGFTPPIRTDHLFTAFLADEVTLIPNRLDIAAGVKAEHNQYSGFEWQPNARLLWTVTPTQTVSASVARAVRTPSRVEREFTSANLLNPDVPMFVRLNPNPDFDSEVLTALELGWVSQWRPWLSWTVAAFRNSHDRVLSLELGPPFAESDADGRRVIVPVSFGNGLTGHSTGIEVTTQIQPRPWWRTTAGYSHLSMSIAARPDSRDAGLVERSNGITPRHQLQVVTTLRPSSSVTATWFLRAIGEVPAVNVPAYTTSRLHVEWQVRPNASLFVTGRNLHHASHVEFDDGRNGTTGIRRSFMAGVRWER